MALSAALAMPAFAGPPFETDDPAPTDTRHWELYMFVDAGGRGAEFDGAGGVDVNYGLVPGVQLTATLPLRVSSGGGADVVVGDMDFSVKYRFLRSRRTGWSAAVAPIATVPVLVRGGISAQPALRLPLWIGWEENRPDNRGWAIFGGGGRAFQAAMLGRDIWFGGIVATHGLPGHARIGFELSRRGRESEDSPGETGLALGCIVPIAQPFVLHAAGGPRFIDGEVPNYRFYVAIMAGF